MDGTRKSDRSGTPTTRARLRVLAALLGLVFGLSIVGSIVNAGAAESPGLAFDYKMADRFGRDDNGDGLIDYKTAPSFVKPSSWSVDLTACGQPAITDDVAKFRWTVGSNPPITVAECKTAVPFAALGSYSVKLELLSSAGTVLKSATQTVALKDTLIVSVGDSVASGEGNPDRLVHPGSPSGGAIRFGPEWEELQCNRSALAGPAQAALRLEKRDPHSSITFIHLACSGARIGPGLLETYEGINPPADPAKYKKPQLVEAQEIATAAGRKIDAMFMSIGANDAKFSELVALCIEFQDCHTATFPAGKKNAQQVFDEEIVKLPPEYVRLDAKLDAMKAANVLTDKVFITQYYDPSTGDSGAYCAATTPEEKEGDVGQVVDGISATEWKWASETVVAGVNAKVSEAATTYGWTFVDGIADSFKKHGYCARDRWVRTLTESFLYQRDKNGAFHPNYEGHLFGYAAKIEEKAAPALGIGGTPVPFESSADALFAVDGLGSFLGFMDQMDVLEKLLDAAPFGAREKLQAGVQKLFDTLAKVQALASDLSNRASMSLTRFDAWMDDLDSDGDLENDVHIPGLKVDVSGAISPHLPASKYDVKVRLKISVDETSDFAYLADSIKLNGKPLSSLLDYDHEFNFHLEPKFGTSVPKLRLRVPASEGETRLKLSADFGDTDPTHGSNTGPLSANLGLLGASIKGTADADIGVKVGFKDPNGDGYLDATEIADLPDMFSLSCVSSGAKLNLTASASLAGLEGKVGKITLDDTNLCNGVSTPTLQLAELGQFRNLTPADIINGLAQLTTALRNIQESGDFDIPFVKEGLSKVVAVNEKLVKFFVDNGLTDPADPLSSIVIDPTKEPDLDTIQELVPKLAAAFGIDPTALGMKWEAGKLSFDLNQAADPGPVAAGGTLDLGDQLGPAGLIDLESTGSASIDPAYSVKLGLGVDLATPDLALADRFYLKVGAGPEVTLDGIVKADLDVDGKVAFVGVNLTDTNATGPVTLAERRDPTRPMVEVDITDKNADGRLTLAELATATSNAQSPVKFLINAKVPCFGLKAATDIGGHPLAGGTVNVCWNDVTKLTGTDALKVTVDDTFLKTLLPLAFDPNNPKASVTRILTAAREVVVALRDIVQQDTELVASLPLVGRSAGDLDPMLGKLATTIDELLAITDALTLERAESELERVMGEALGIAEAKRAALVDLRLEPATVDRPAALTIKLALSGCTTDRNSPVCTYTTAPVNLPLSLKLGNTSDAMGLLSTSGNATVSFDARANLEFGVQLPSVTPGATPGSLPVVSGAPSLFVYDTSSLEVGLGLRVNGTLTAALGPVEVNLGKDGSPATAKLAARYKLAKVKPTGEAKQRVVIGSSAWSTYLGQIAPTTGTDISETVEALKTGCADSADACASMPVFLGGASLGSCTFAAPDLLVPANWTYGCQSVIDNLKSMKPELAFSLVLEGLRMFTEKIEHALASMPPGSKIPLIGADPTAGADILAKFRTEIVEPAQDLVTDIESKTQAKAIEDTIVAFFDEHVGPGSEFPLLRGTVTAQTWCKPSTTEVECADTAGPSTIRRIEIQVPLGGSVEGAAPPFDIGFPGLRLASKGELTASASWELDLAFGIGENGFYFPTNKVANNGAELRVTARAALPNADGASDLEGDIAFIPVAIEDRHAGDDVKVTLGVNLSGGDTNSRLGLQQLGTAKLEPSVLACANVDLGLVTGGLPGVNSSLPSLQANMKVRGGYQCNGDLGAPTGTGFSIDFDDVKLNVGDFLTKFVKPVTKHIRNYTSPMEPVIEAVQEPIPGVAEAARMAGLEAPSWYDLFKKINDLNVKAGQPDQLAYIDKAIFFINLVETFDTVSTGGAAIPLGSFDVDVAAVKQAVPSEQIGSALKNVVEAAGGASVLDRLGEAGVKVELSDKLSQADAKAGLEFPAFEDPSQLFQLLLGKDVPLVRYDAGRLFAEAKAYFTYPIGPFNLFIGGGASIEGHFAAGFDTYGIRQAIKVLTDDDPANNGLGSIAASVLGGFYIDDLDRDGTDVPEVKLRARMTAGAGVGFLGFGIKVEGGVRGEADIDLNDDDDGRVRYDEVITQLKLNPNPVCLFNARAKIDAFIEGRAESPFGDVVYPVADVVLLDQPDLTAFCKIQQEPGENKLTGTLYTDGTLDLKTTDGPDTIYARWAKINGELELMVNSQGVSETWTGVSRVFADGKGGDDRITIESMTTEGHISAHLCGGEGRDSLSHAAGAAKLFGDNGDGMTADDNGTPIDLSCTATSAPGADTLTGGPLLDVVDAGPGNDALLGGGGNDTLKGLAGNDTMLGGEGNDTIDGGADRDTTSYADRSDGDFKVQLPGPSGRIGTAEADSTISVESAVGSPNNDEVIGLAAGNNNLDGLSGNDVVKGGNLADVLVGGSNNDTFHGGQGINTLIGGWGDDLFVAGPGSDQMIGEDGADTVDYAAETGPVHVTLDGVTNDGRVGDPLPDNVLDVDKVVTAGFDDRVIGSTRNETFVTGGGLDYVDGAGGNDTVQTGADDDEIEAGDGDDKINAGNGNDDLFGGTGGDQLFGEGGDDFLDGQFGPDDLSGGEGNDTVDYSKRTAGVCVRVAIDSLDGQKAPTGTLGPDCSSSSRCDNVFGDNEHLVGTAFDDRLEGDASAELIEGGDGDDTLVGAKGADVLEGQDGNDWLEIVINGPQELTDGVTFRGGDGDDFLRAGWNDDLLEGGDGNDRLGANRGSDILKGGEGDDELDAGAHVDVAGAKNVLISGPGNDDTTSGAGDDTHEGNEGNDVLHDQGGTNTLDAGPGDDEIDAGTGNDTMIGGDGPDRMFASAGDDHVEMGEGGGFAYGSFGDDTIIGGSAPEDLRGDDGDDVVRGNGGDDDLSGANGEDDIEGGEGDDDLFSGSGTPGTPDKDHLKGGPGNDYHQGGADVDLLEGGPGNDRFNGGLGDDKVFGNDGDDILHGDEGNDLLDAGVGADVVNGEEGFDRLTYEDRTEPLTITTNSGANDGGASDKAVGGSTPADNVGWDVEHLVLGSGDDNVTLNSLTAGQTGLLEGRGGNDTLVASTSVTLPVTFRGGAGNDTETGGNGPDTFDEQGETNGADVIVGRGGADVADYGARVRPTTVSLNGVADDGEVDEKDNVGNDIETSKVPTQYAPSAPRSVTATTSNGTISVSWLAPTTAGTSAITGYELTSVPGGITKTVGAATLSTTMTGFAGGTPYTIEVRAVNAIGEGPAGTSNAVTPTGFPGAPTSVTATAASGQATVNWAAPASTGSGPITGYKVTVSPGGAVVTVGNVLTTTIPGLTNGTAYTFTVQAVNASGTGPASTPSAAVTPAGPPGTPGGVAATPGNTSATVTWSAAAANGSPITGYKVTVSPGGAVKTVGNVLSTSVTGLTNGSSYTFTVKAVNAKGESVPSAPSNAVTPAAAPGAPTGVTATAGDGQATVTWTAPAATGGASITGYRITAAPGGETAIVGNELTGTVTGLTNGLTYTFTVQAINGTGPGAASAPSNAVTPSGPPAAPTGVSAVPGDGQAVVTWAASGTGGSPITGYKVVASPGGATLTVGPVLTATVPGLTNGTAYTFTVRAVNAKGESPASVASAPVTPAAGGPAGGDFNGDGFVDLAVGAPGEDLGGKADAGAVDVLYGGPGGLTEAGDQEWSQGANGLGDVAETGDRFGSSIAAGDFDGDGYSDLAVGVPYEEITAQTDAGAVQVLFGSPTGLGVAKQQLLTQGTGGIADAKETSDRFGSVLDAADTNGDGIDDLAVGTALENVGSVADAGIVQVIPGSPSGLSGAADTLWRHGSGAPGTAEAGDKFGSSVALGDVNGDGRADLAVGSPGEDLGTAADMGTAIVLYTGGSGLTGSGAQTWQQNVTGVVDTGEKGDRFGASVALGDLNGDGRADLAVGVPGEDIAAKTDAGAVQTLLASAATNRLGTSGNKLWYADLTGVAGSGEASAQFGSTVATGDLTGDGRAELVVGVPLENVGTKADAGVLVVLRGTASGPTATGSVLWYQDAGGVLDASEAGDRFGNVLNVADLTGDGKGDLAVGVGLEDVGTVADAGAVQVLNGASGGLTATGNRVWTENTAGVAGTAEAGDGLGAAAATSAP